jgi:hypothetical protein
VSQQTAFAEQQAAAARKALPASDRRQAARVMYRESVDAGMPMTAKELGEAFGRGVRWGHEQIASVRRDLAQLAEFANLAPEPEAAPDLAEPADDRTSVEPEPLSADAAAEVQALADSEAAEGIDAVAEAPEFEASASETAESNDMPSPPESARRRPWPLVLLALPAFVAVWSGWVGIGRLTGFGVVNLLPGIVPEGGWATIDTAITLPVGVEAYGAYALSVWLAGSVPARARRFAFWSAIGSLLVGMTGQGAYHLMIANPQWLVASDDGALSAPWPIVVLVSCLPVAVLGMGAALAHLVRATGGERR